MTHGETCAIVDALIYGGSVLVDTAPGPIPVHRALKNPRSPCQSTATAGPKQFTAPRTTRHLSLHTTGMQQPVLSSTSCNCGSSAVSSTSALENCIVCTIEVDHLIDVLQLRNSVVNEPRESASSPRQGCQRHCRKNTTSRNCGMSTVSSQLRPSLQDLHNQSSITLSMNCNCGIPTVTRTMGISL